MNITITNVALSPSNIVLTCENMYALGETEINLGKALMTVKYFPASSKCPMQMWTEDVYPSVITNWWTVSGPGSFSTSGEGLWASWKTPMETGQGTVTFYIQYTNYHLCPAGVQTATNWENFTVIEETEPFAEWFPLSPGCECVPDVPQPDPLNWAEDDCGNRLEIWCQQPPGGGAARFYYKYNGIVIGECVYLPAENAFWYRYTKRFRWKEGPLKRRFHSTWHLTRETNSWPYTQGTWFKIDWIVWKYNCLTGEGPAPNCRENSSFESGWDDPNRPENADNMGQESPCE